MKDVSKNFDSTKEMTVNEACLILDIRNSHEMNPEYIKKRFDTFHSPTKEISPYLADRFESARDKLYEELNHKERETKL